MEFDGGRLLNIEDPGGIGGIAEFAQVLLAS